MNLSANFTLEEATRSQTAVRMGISNAPTPEIIDNMKSAAERMEDLRVVLGGYPITVSSWYRSLELNRAIGGSATSAHLTGWAIDFVCPKAGEPLVICRKIRWGGPGSVDDFDQLIQEGQWVHISFDPKNRKQVLTAHFVNGRVSYTEGIS